jgi:hypothetical protein
MKITLGTFTISVNDDKVKDYASKSNFIGDIVKLHKFTGIEDDKLKEAFGDIYDILKPDTKKEKKEPAG